MKLIVGLGNPGPKYANTRHNIGFDALDVMAEAWEVGEFREKFKGHYGKARVGGDDIFLLKPGTYMNLSGQSVRALCTFFKVQPQEVLVLHDELDLPFGQMRLKQGGGHGGHNGLRSIIADLGSPDFARLRLGIGRPPAGFRGEVSDFVLGHYPPIEKALLPDMLKGALGAARHVLRMGVGQAMNRVNARKKPKPKKPKPKKPKPAKPPAEAEKTPQEGDPALNNPKG